ncbi:Mor transcription activator family protein [Canicola haemoglobinophilus]|uniref:Mor transcription activator family protein n=1 Tax=Canicola haemoglobinophilus TaxID=733 RepID=UPI0013013892
MKVALRDIEIYQRFAGNNIAELTKEFNLSESHIYAILREQRKLQKERNDKNPKLH